MSKVIPADVSQPQKADFLTPTRREALYGYLFTSPWSLGFLIWVAGPIVASLYYSFTMYGIIGRPEFVGFGNYDKAFTSDPLFWPSLIKTFYYVGLTVPLGIIGSLLAASALNQKVPFKTVFRGLFYLPSLTPAAALAVLWGWMLHPQIGPVNYLLRIIFDIQGPEWLASTHWAIPSLAIMALWGSIGGNRMLIFLAGLQGVPEELYEAAEIDGANPWHRFWHVTLPLISPTIFFNLVLGMIGALKVFSSAYVATRGGPARATWFIALHIYTNAFHYFQMGYASALAWLFLIILLVFTWIQFRVSNRWVYYAGGGR